jgi:hypothetical protein
LPGYCLLLVQCGCGGGFIVVRSFVVVFGMNFIPHQMMKSNETAIIILHYPISINYMNSVSGTTPSPKPFLVSVSLSVSGGVFVLFINYLINNKFSFLINTVSF